VAGADLFAVVRRRFAILSLICAWLFANGAVLNGLQAVAWAKMLHDYAQRLPLRAALARTFDASAPCELCGAVQDLRKKEPQAPLERASERIVLACQTAEPVLFATEKREWRVAFAERGPNRCEPVPVRPPRA
jgi:hypothetical protein